MSNQVNRNYEVTYKAVSANYKSITSIQAENLSLALTIAIDKAWSLKNELGFSVSLNIKAVV